MPMANTNQKGRASMKANYPINRHISTIYRLSQAYFDKKLKPYGIGCGQQFFLLRIHEHPGISVLELGAKRPLRQRARPPAPSRSWSSRAMCAASRAAWISGCGAFTPPRRPCRDRKTREITAIWRGKLTDGFTDEEREQALALLERMSQNARAFVRQGDGDPT